MEAYKSMHKKKIIYCSKVILVNILLIIFFIIIAEIIFGNWFKNKNYGNLLIPKYNVNLIKNPPYKSPYATGVFSRDKNGFRANNYNLDSINILVLGGAGYLGSTFVYYLLKLEFGVFVQNLSNHCVI